MAGVMTDRIDTLAKQCWSHRIDGTLIDGHLHFDHRRFAELIIRECCQKLENDGMVEVAMELKQHFGVEE
jgi:hypothetical protein